MRAFYIIAMLMVLLLPFGAQAATPGEGLLTIELAEHQVDITSGFNGAKLVLFGVKRADGDIAVVIKGPSRNMVVRHKDQLMGIWMNREAVSFRDVPVYYDYAVSTVETDLAPIPVREKNSIGLDVLEFNHYGREDPETVKRFREALIRNKQTQGHYPLKSENIYFMDNNFFRVNFFVPSDVPAGNYQISTFLFKNGEVTEMKQTQLRVGQVGFSARIYDFGHKQSIFYGLAAVLLALMAGWTAYALLQR